MKRQRLFRFIAIAAASFVAVAPAFPGASGAPSLPPRVVFITIDTLRADHLPMYGYPLNTAPFLSELATRGVLYENFIAAAAVTGPCHASMFTSLYPDEHRLLVNGQPLDAGPVTMAEHFSRAGYATGAFTSVGFLKAVTRGFHEVSVPPGIAKTPGDKDVSRTAAVTVDRALRWAQNLPKDRKMFLWVHVFDIHGSTPGLDPDFDPWGKKLTREMNEEKRAALRKFWTERGIKPGSRDPAFLQQNHSYDARIRYTDAQLKRLYEGLTGPGQPPTLWIITSDHGEALRDHGNTGHRIWINQEQVHVPLLLVFPDGRDAGKRVAGLASQLDLLPTIGAGLGLPVDKRWEGRPLWPFGPERASECLICRGPRGKNVEVPKRQYALLSGRWKLFWSPTEGKDELYDLDADPHELHNLSDTNLETTDKMKKRLLAIVLRINPRLDESDGKTRIDPARVEELKSLGYLQ